MLINGPCTPLKNIMGIISMGQYTQRDSNADIKKEKTKKEDKGARRDSSSRAELEVNFCTSQFCAALRCSASAVTTHTISTDRRPAATYRALPTRRRCAAAISRTACSLSGKSSSLWRPHNREVYLQKPNNRILSLPFIHGSQAKRYDY